MIGVDNDTDFHMFNAPHTVADLIIPDASELDMIASGSVDFVFSSHLLEHIEDYKTALKEWWRVVKPGGHLCLYLPHRDLYPRIGQRGANPDHKHDFSNQDIIDVMSDLGGWDLVRDEIRGEEQEYSFFQVYKKISSKEHRWSCHRSKPNKKTAAVVRYGAWGDALQASSAIAALKREGYHITFYCTPRAMEVLKLDPNIDDFYVQDTDQIPNDALPYFWEWEERKYDKWVNLSQTVEDSWLALDGHAKHRWPHSVRHKYLNVNYVQFQHEIAEVPYSKPLSKFYPSPEEVQTMDKKVRKWDAEPLVLFAASGSSGHKVWPYMDQIIARILVTYPKGQVVIVGNELDEILQDPWEKEPRVKKMCNVLSIRETLTLAQMSDIVIGPETGVLNSVAMEPIPKIVLLSHSSHENLTRDWINTFAVFSTRTKCYPCHILHYNFDYCHRDPGLGTAKCQTDIPADAVWEAFRIGLSQFGTRDKKVIQIAAA